MLTPQTWSLPAVPVAVDECRIRKDHAARALAMIRRAVRSLLRREPSTLALGQKRRKAARNPDFRAAILAARRVMIMPGPVLPPLTTPAVVK